MARGNRPTARVDPAGQRMAGERLVMPLGLVVAVAAEGLQVRRIEGELGVKAARLDVIDQRAGFSATGHLAAGKTPAMVCAQFAPGRRVVKRPRVGLLAEVEDPRSLAEPHGFRPICTLSTGSTAVLDAKGLQKKILRVRARRGAPARIYERARDSISHQAPSSSAGPAIMQTTKLAASSSASAIMTVPSFRRAAVDVRPHVVARQGAAARPLELGNVFERHASPETDSAAREAELGRKCLAGPELLDDAPHRGRGNVRLGSTLAHGGDSRFAMHRRGHLSVTYRDRR